MPRPEPLIPPAPSPSPVDPPLVRLVVAFRRNALRAWPRRAYEDDVLVRPFLGRTSVLLNAPDGIRRVLVDNHANYGRTPATVRVLRPLVGEDGLFLSEGDAWRRRRRLVAPAFAPRALDLMARHAAAVADETVRGLGARSSGAVDLLAAMQRLTLEVAARSMLSAEMARHGPDLRRRMDGYRRRLARPYLLDIVLPLRFISPHDLGRRRFARGWFGLIERIIAERARTPPAAQPRDLFDLLAAARDPVTGGPLAPGELRDQVATLLVAGHETTALGLFWALYLLALAPAVQEDLAAEAAPVDLAPEAAAGALPRLPLARAVIQEALRLYPPAFTIVRAARGPDRLAGVEVPPRALVMVAPWVLHRHRRLWHAPEAFDPARFLPAAEPPDRFAYLPFGAGPRVCVGARFALIEATLVLAKLARAFRIELVEPRRPVMPVAVVTTYPDRAPAFRLRPR